MAAASSAGSTEPSGPTTRRSSSFTAGSIPAIPKSLPVWAAMIPAIAVPWSSGGWSFWTKLFVSIGTLARSRTVWSIPPSMIATITWVLRIEGGAVNTSNALISFRFHCRG